MNNIFKFIYLFIDIFKRAFNKVFIVPGLKALLYHCGENVRLSYNLDIRGFKNISIGNNTQIGPHALLWSTRAKIIIGNYVLIGPNLTIITGDHRIDVIGKHIIEVNDKEKLLENDKDVIIEDGVWIGANVTILKGVKIGEGSILAAGSVVTRDVESYCIYAGNPARKIKDRFEKDDLNQHIIKLNK